MKFLLVVAFLQDGSVRILDPGTYYDTKKECQLMGELYGAANHTARWKCYVING